MSESAVEFPNVESLFDPTVGVPPGFARSLVNVAIDAGADYLEIDFDNAGFGSYAPGFKNTYVFSFTAPLALRITSVVIDPRTNLGLTPDRVTFNGNELFVNVQRLFFNRNSFARFNLTTVAESGPGGENPSDPDTVAVPEPSSMLLMGGAALMGAAFKRHRARQQSERTPVS